MRTDVTYQPELIGCLLGVVAAVTVMSGCTLTYGEVDTTTEEQVSQKITEEKEAPEDDISHTITQKDDVVEIQFSRKRECHTRTDQVIADVEHRTIDSKYPLIDIVVGGLTIVAGGIYIAVGPPLGESEPRDIGLGWMAVGAGFAALGGYTLMAFPEEEETGTRLVEGDWETSTCRDVPLQATPVTAALANHELFDGESDTRGVITISIADLEEAYISYGDGIPQIEMTIDAAFLDSPHLSTKLVSNDLVSKFEDRRRTLLLEQVREGNDEKAALEFTERYSDADEYEEVLTALAEFAVESKDLNYVLDTMETFEQDNASNFEAVHEQAIELVIENDTIDAYHEYFAALSSVGKYPDHDELLEHYSEKWVAHAFEVYVEQLEEDALDEVPSLPSELPPRLAQSISEQLVSDIHEHHLAQARRARDQAYSSVSMDDARQTAQAFFLTAKHSQDDEARDALEVEVDDFADSFRQRQRDSWPSRKQEAFAQCRPARDGIQRIQRRVRQLEAQGRVEELQKYVDQSTDDLERYTKELQEAGEKVIQITEEMRMEGIHFTLPEEGRDRRYFVEWNDNGVSQERIFETKRQLETNCST